CPTMFAISPLDAVRPCESFVMIPGPPLIAVASLGGTGGGLGGVTVRRDSAAIGDMVGGPVVAAGGPPGGASPSCGASRRAYGWVSWSGPGTGRLTPAGSGSGPTGAPPVFVPRGTSPNIGMLPVYHAPMLYRGCAILPYDICP